MRAAKMTISAITSRMVFLIIIFLVITVHVDQAWSQGSDRILYQNDFEGNLLPPNVSIHTVGNFTSSPGIKETAHFGSTRAFGFGKTDCITDCWFNATTTLRIELPVAMTIALIAFDEAELEGNWGSSGYVKVDGQDVNDGLFEREPWNDLTADSTYRHREMYANLFGRVIEITVIDITSASEMFIDNVVILTYDYSPHRSIFDNFSGGSLSGYWSVQTTGSFTQQPGFRFPSQMGGSQAFGFGRSDCRISCGENNSTSLTWDLGAEMIITGIAFREMEVDTNWGNQGIVYIDDHVVPNSTFGNLPTNNGETDSTFREHIIPICQTGRRITLKVYDITSLSEIVIDDLWITIFDPVGQPIRFEGFESPAFPGNFSVLTRGGFISLPGMRPTNAFGSSWAFGFGMSDCNAFCFHDNETILSLNMPETKVEGIRFKAMEMNSNFGSRGEIFINGQLWPGMDFSRLPLNDWSPDNNFRTFYLTPGYGIHQIDWVVWDITGTSEVFIDDIELISAEPGSVEDRDQPPAQFRLMQNYPNPFNASTTITYSLSEAAPVLMTIYNAQGQTVERRDLGRQQAGVHKIEWNAEPHPSATYYCRLETPEVVKVIRLLLIR